ncbi:MAG: RNA polymerase sporulation sigma factor SigH [Candidatus Anoxymicrobium japonicum]|uniref:RNA polymerase sigma factor SigS n=1 Tax=Candidatus Anoxymicrobium japonicum TaxID=2013648 RepID=A0A2N3G5G7_9ACTN|nr:MAG: RNA polymerase sporulation sigma factor SigH [Candidatus Anoxymicrobium japonicum]
MARYKTTNPSVKKYHELSDKELVRCSKSGDRLAESVLINRYKYLAHLKARSYFLPGADHEDTVQEGMIGLFKAIRDFKEGELCSFRSFAILCVTRQIITAVKTHARKKHNPLSSYQSLDAPSSDENLLDTLASHSRGSEKSEDPLNLFIFEEELDTVIAILRDKLSDLEWSVFIKYLDSRSYQEIAEDLMCETKVVDNALCRIKQKIKKECEFSEATG